MASEEALIAGGTQSFTLTGAAPAGPEAPSAPSPSPVEPGTGEGADRPDWLPAEFATPQQFREAYEALAKPPSESPGTPAPEEPPAGAPGDEATPWAARVTEDAGLDYSAVSDYYAENGTLAEEHYTAFDAAGLPRELIDGYLAGQGAILAQFKSTVLASTGGEELWTSAAEWAGAGNFSEAELSAYNAAVDSGDPAQAVLAVQGLVARYQNRTGVEPNLADGQGGASDVPGYESQAQFVADINNPLYAKDPAFRAKVESRAARSSF